MEKQLERLWQVLRGSAKWVLKRKILFKITLEFGFIIYRIIKAIEK